MTRLSEVVRGVEEKEIDNREIYKDGQIRTGIAMNQGKIKGHNNLASAEVVVDREKIGDIVGESMHYECSCKPDYQGGFIPCKKCEEAEKVSQAIATAIESGAVLYLKEKE